jgi:chemotaxis signal transduction protein
LRPRSTANVVEAVDARSLQTLPKTESWCAGYLMFGGTPIIVADMARLLRTTNIETPRMIVVIRAPARSSHSVCWWRRWAIYSRSGATGSRPSTD